MTLTKRILPLLPVIMCFFGTSATCLAGDPVTLNITGNIVASPCQIDPDSVVKNIHLGDNLQASDLATSGKESAQIEVHVKLINCPAGTSFVTATFHGTPASTLPDWLYENVGTAQNVAVGLQANSTWGLGDGHTYDITITPGVDPDFKFYAFAYSLGNATPGTINSVVTLSFAYN